MKIVATEVKAADLQPGDLFSLYPIEYWDTYDKKSIGQKVYIRTEETEYPVEDKDALVTLITIEK